MPDHAALFVKLKEAVEVDIVHSVVILQAKDCTSIHGFSKITKINTCSSYPCSHNHYILVVVSY